MHARCLKVNRVRCPVNDVESSASFVSVPAPIDLTRGFKYMTRDMHEPIDSNHTSYR